jgi:hypothetical protein
MCAHGFDQRCEEFACGSDPSGERGAVEVDSFTGIDLRLAVERLMIGVLRDQHVSEQARTGEPAIDGTGRRRGLHDAVAHIAAQLRAHMADDLEARPYVLQHLGGIFA